MFENRVKKLLDEGKVALGAGCLDSELMAKLTVNTGVDFIWVDTEHLPFEMFAIRWIPLICRMKGCAPMIRVAGLDPQLIKKALDIGASTIMIPQINTADEARRAVQYCKYPPQGTRGVSPTWTLFLDISWDDYLPVANEEICVVAQIETPEGIRNLEAIAEVEGVDVLFAGPMDLAASLGHIGKPQHPEVQNFIQEFPRRVSRCGKPSGITLRGFEPCKKALEQGYRFVAIGSTLFQGINGLTADLTRLREWADGLRQGAPSGS